MSGGPSTTTTTQSLPPWATQYAKQFLGQGASLANNQPYSSALNYQVAGLNQDQQTALSQSQGISAIGAGQLSSTLAGNYLSPNSNPWLAQTANAATQGLVNQSQTSTAPSLMAEGIGAGGGGPGSLGSNFYQQQDANQYGLGQNIGNTEASIYGTNYTNERSNQINSLNNMGQIEAGLLAPGTFEQQQSQNVLNANQQNAAQQNQYPWTQLQRFASIFSPLTGGFSVGTQPNPMATK